MKLHTQKQAYHQQQLSWKGMASLTGSRRNRTTPLLGCDILREFGTGVFYHVKLRDNGAPGSADLLGFRITVTVLKMTTNEHLHVLEHVLDID
jgi:hypothetical protein